MRTVMEAEGEVVIRAAGSMGTVDLVGVRKYADGISGLLDPIATVRFVEVKSTITPYAHFSPSERLELLTLAKSCGASAWLAWWPARGALKWIPSGAWPLAS